MLGPLFHGVCRGDQRNPLPSQSPLIDLHAVLQVSSLLDHYKLQYGPSILLQMNLAYFLPSIPLLLISSCLDDWLDKRYGTQKPIFRRRNILVLPVPAVPWICWLL